MRRFLLLHSFDQGELCLCENAVRDQQLAQLACEGFHHEAAGSSVGWMSKAETKRAVDSHQNKAAGLYRE